LHWERPRYIANPRVPFIPLETELDILIHGTRRNLSVLLQTLKETGCRIGEALRLRWVDIDAERSIIRVNNAEKGSLNRSIRVSANMIQRLQVLVKKSEYVFPLHREGITSRYGFVRKRLAQEHGNPRLLSISFHTFRHWFGTTQYHKTKDILYVKQLLGHVRIENTLIYISLEQSLYGMNENAEFHVRAATTLEEACELLKQGFDFVTDMNGSKLFRKRQ
jgi:integrase